MLGTAMAGYLMTLYTLGHAAAGAAVRTGALATALGVAASSATGMLKKLAGLGLVEHTPRRGAPLTPAGEAIALRGLWRQRLLTCYLRAALGYDRDAAHEEAARLAPAVSEAVAARLRAALGDPHGDPTGDCVRPVQVPSPVASRSGVPRTATASCASVRGMVPADRRYNYCETDCLSASWYASGEQYVARARSPAGDRNEVRNRAGE